MQMTSDISSYIRIFRRIHWYRIIQVTSGEFKWLQVTLKISGDASLVNHSD